MIEPPLPADEAKRLAALHAYDVLDSEPEQAFDDLTRLASWTIGAPIALVSLVDAERQWFKSKVGLTACETPRAVAFCAHAILTPDRPMVVRDARQDERFADNPLVTDDPNVVFYAGVPLVNSEGMALGTLCVIDHQPRQIDAGQLEALQRLASQTVMQLELRRKCSELKELSAQLNRANRDLQEFNAMVAHDLQEPLRKIVSFGALLEADIGTDLPPTAATDLKYMTDAAHRMHALINDLLALSRANAGGLSPERMELRSCVDSALDTLSLRIEESGAEVSVDPLPQIVGDRTLLVQLFQNLVGNALKFRGEAPPRVQVTCRSEGERTVIGVQDNGIGIEPRFAGQIFAPFKRLHGREAYEGTGIGLSIARKAVERHGGEIWVESEPGGGSHFRFVLRDLARTPDEGQTASTQPEPSLAR